jgi:putative salt-induced outer membrane protein YdiY
MKHRRLVCALILSAVTPLLCAQDGGDRVTLRERTLDGEVIAVDREGVTLAGEAGAPPRRVSWKDLTPGGLQTAKPISIPTGSGDRITGRVTGFRDDAITVSLGSYGQLVIPTRDLAEPAPLPVWRPEGAVFDPGDWTGNVRLGGLLQAGNTDSTTVELGAALERFWAMDHLTVKALARYGRSNGVTTAGLYQLVGQHRHFFDGDFYGYGLADVSRNEVLNIDFRFVMGVGAGMNVYRDGNDRSLNLEAGINALYEQKSGMTGSWSPAGRVALAYLDRFFEKLRFTQDAAIVFPLNDFGDYQLESLTTLSMPLVEAWALYTSLLLIHKGRPAAGARKTDLTLTLGVEYAF